MKVTRAILIGGLLLVLGMVLGAEISGIHSKLMKVAGYSNRYALETDLIHGLVDYHKANGRYPDSLDVIKIPWLANEDDRRKELLKPFYYENRGDSYVLWWPRKEM